MASFQLVKEQVTIEATVQQLGLELRPTGAALRGACPACKTGGPRALVITPSKQLFYCFSAGIGGDLISLWGHIQKCSLADAGRQIADTFGVEEPSAPSARVKEQVHRSEEATPPQAEKVAGKPPTHFDATAFAAKLEYSEAVQALGLSEQDAQALGIGVHRGKLYLAMRYSNGDISGFAAVEGAKLPAKLLPNTSNVVQLKRPA